MIKIVLIRSNGHLLNAITEDEFRKSVFFGTLVNKTTTPSMGEEVGKPMRFFLDNYATVDHITECEWIKPGESEWPLAGLFNTVPSETVYTFETTFLK